jgi:hypothetical protein
MKRAKILLFFSAGVLFYMVCMIYSTFYLNTPIVSVIRELTMIPVILSYVVLFFLNAGLLIRPASRNSPFPWITMVLHVVTALLFLNPEIIL